MNDREDVELVIADSLHELSGNTPLVRLSRLNKTSNATVVVKMEGLNPSGSVKDRIALAMVEAAERDGSIQAGRSTVIEATSGSVGVALASIAARRGYRLILTMPESVSIERRALLLAYGAEVHLTPSILGMQGAVSRAEELQRACEGSCFLRQFANLENPSIHRMTTGPEIWRDTGGMVDILVCPVGTGGTITGISQFVKPLKPNFWTVAVQPQLRTATIEEGDQQGSITGMEVNFVPAVMQPQYVDETIYVWGKDAARTCRQLAKQEGILTGGSGGAVVLAALQVAERPNNRGKLIVVVLPDCGERSLGTPFGHRWQDRARELPVVAPGATLPLRRIESGSTI